MKFTLANIIVLETSAFWNAAPCNLVEVYRRLRHAYDRHHQRISVDLKEAVAAETHLADVLTLKL